MSTGVLDAVNNRQPFGLPLGTVRGVLSLLIVGFVWMVLLWPGDTKLPLSHFFLAALVLMAFTSSPRVVPEGESHFLPWLLRVLVAGGTAGVVVFVMFSNPDALTRLRPAFDMDGDWWLRFLAVLACGFGAGLFLRFILGRENHVFQTVRAWLSVLGLVMMVIEFALFMAFASAKDQPTEFLHYWQAIELAAVSAYFGTRT